MFKRNKVRSGGSYDLPTLDTIRQEQTMTSDEKIIKKINEDKVEESKTDNNKSMEERLKKFANLKLIT